MKAVDSLNGSSIGGRNISVNIAKYGWNFRKQVVKAKPFREAEKYELRGVPGMSSAAGLFSQAMVTPRTYSASTGGNLCQSKPKLAGTHVHT